jgi:hypothetical protein
MTSLPKETLPFKKLFSSFVISYAVLFVVHMLLLVSLAIFAVLFKRKNELYAADSNVSFFGDVIINARFLKTILELASILTPYTIEPLWSVFYLVVVSFSSFLVFKYNKSVAFLCRIYLIVVLFTMLVYLYLFAI